MKTIFCLCLLFAAPIRAQEAGSVTCRLLNFQREVGEIDISTLFVVNAAGEATECGLPRDTLSKPVKLPLLDNSVTFRKEIAGPPIAIARIPSGINQALILFLPSDDPKFSFKPVVLDGSEKAFPESGCLVLNLYREDVRFVLGEHKILLPPGKSSQLPRPEQRDNFNMSAVMFQFNTEKGWRAAYETMTRFTEGQRHLYVSYVDPKDNRPKVRAYRD